MKKEHHISIEKIAHFQCASCKKWWSIGDAPTGKKDWFCPWCGMKARVEKKKTS